MTKHDFDIDLFWLLPEPENWFDTIQVPLSDEEANILVNAIIDQHFLLPPNDIVDGDDYLIIERAPEVHTRVLKQMEEEAESRGWTDCVPQFNRVNICFGTSLYELAESNPRWKELELTHAKH